jgi:hypothetical protein
VRPHRTDRAKRPQERNRVEAEGKRSIDEARNTLGEERIRAEIKLELLRQNVAAYAVAMYLAADAEGDSGSGPGAFDGEKEGHRSRCLVRESWPAERPPSTAARSLPCDL